MVASRTLPRREDDGSGRHQVGDASSCARPSTAPPASTTSRPGVGITKARHLGRLSELVDAGLLAKQPYQEPGQRSATNTCSRAGHGVHARRKGHVRVGRHYFATRRYGCRTPVRRGGDVAIRCADGHDVAPDELEVRTARRAGMRPPPGEPGVRPLLANFRASPISSATRDWSAPVLEHPVHS